MFPLEAFHLQHQDPRNNCWAYNTASGYLQKTYHGWTKFNHKSLALQMKEKKQTGGLSGACKRCAFPGCHEKHNKFIVSTVSQFWQKMRVSRWTKTWNLPAMAFRRRLVWCAINSMLATCCYKFATYWSTLRGTQDKEK